MRQKDTEHVYKNWPLLCHILHAKRFKITAAADAQASIHILYKMHFCAPLKLDASWVFNKPLKDSSFLRNFSISLEHGFNLGNVIFWKKRALCQIGQNRRVFTEWKSIRPVCSALCIFVVKCIPQIVMYPILWLLHFWVCFTACICGLDLICW